MASNQIVHHKPDDSGLWMLVVIMLFVVLVPWLSEVTLANLWHTVVCSVACFPGLLIIALWLIHDAYSTQKDKNRTPEEREKIREEDERIYRQCRGLDPWEASRKASEEFSQMMKEHKW